MISKRAKSINPSPTLAITARAKEMKARGIDVVSFGAGEPDFDTPDHIKMAAIQAINDGFTKYTATSGIPELKKAICEKLKKDNGLDYTIDQILVGNGGKQCLYNILQVLLNPKDEVFIPVPYWVSYEEMVKLAQGKCVFLKTNQEFKIEPKTLKKAITKKTKVLILNSPSNPTGAVYSKKELEEIAEICVKKKIFVISDEIYEELVYGKKHVSIASLNAKIKKLTFVVNGVSKAYSMTGWRIGYVAGDSTVIKAASALQDHSTSNPNSIAQKAALAGLLGSKDTIYKMREAYLRRRNLIVNGLNKIKGIKVAMPDGAFYVFADVSNLYKKGIKGSLDFCGKLLDQAHVAVIPGVAFGDDRYIRLSYAIGDQSIEKGLERIKKFVNIL